MGGGEWKLERGDLEVIADTVSPRFPWCLKGLSLMVSTCQLNWSLFFRVGIVF